MDRAFLIVRRKGGVKEMTTLNNSSSPLCMSLPNNSTVIKCKGMMVIIVTHFLSLNPKSGGKTISFSFLGLHFTCPILYFQFSIPSIKWRLRWWLVVSEERCKAYPVSCHIVFQEIFLHFLVWINQLSKLQCLHRIAFVVAVIALEQVKKTFRNPPLDWNGDPCLPREYTWTGVTCSEGSRIRVVALWVSRIDTK